MIGGGQNIATGPIETHLHRSFNWENTPPRTEWGLRGVRLDARTSYQLNVFG